MHYLIDGHNLIAKLPNLSLDDPDDEAKLTLRLKSWAAGGRKRRVTVVFDGGLPGGESAKLSGGTVTALFASVGKTADSLLITRIQQAKNPAEYTLVSSDQQIIAFAKLRRMPHLSSEAFAAMLGPGPIGLQSPIHLQPSVAITPSPVPSPPAPDPHEQPDLSEGEVTQWLDLFGPEPVIPPKPPPKLAPPPKTATPPPPRLPPAKAKHSRRKLSSEEVDEWMKLFGAEENDDNDDFAAWRKG